MATPAEKLAESLVELEKIPNERGIAIIKANDLSRTHNERKEIEGMQIYSLEAGLVAVSSYPSYQTHLSVQPVSW